MKPNRNYSQLKRLLTFEERLQYLMLRGRVGQDTFGFDRYLNQAFYRSNEWKSVRDAVIARDFGCDLGIIGMEIQPIIVHHMNPITLEDLDINIDLVLNSEYLISTSLDTHNVIHYSVSRLSMERVLPLKRREKGDTCLWTPSSRR
jgi:hypothetical protein